MVVYHQFLPVQNKWDIVSSTAISKKLDVTYNFVFSNDIWDLTQMSSGDDPSITRKEFTNFTRRWRWARHTVSSRNYFVSTLNHQCSRRGRTLAHIGCALRSR